MPTETKTSEKKQRLLNLMRGMFQLDQPDLDFGLYRIMHAKREQVEAFLSTEFDQLIDRVFSSRGARHESEAKNEYEMARQQAVEFGAPDPEVAPKVQQARARYDLVRLSGGEDAEIYDHLYRFFSRYYDDGDFMSLRRYGKGAAGGAETYAVPYDGSEVVLHWANKDQYYIKTTENFVDFSFDPRKAMQKDEKGITKQLFDVQTEKRQELKVHFRIVEAAEGAHGNVKATDKEERYFILDDRAPNAWDGTELVIPINYRPDPEKVGQKAKWQEKLNDQLVAKVLHVLKAAADSGHTLALEYYSVLIREVPKGKEKRQSLLARYVSQYTARNTMDYFIHKDLRGFLRRELDFYLKNEVLKMDDFVGGEDADVKNGLSEARLKAMQNALEKTQVIRLLSQRLIDFLSQLEDFQKKLWLKKKFVLETNYCITLDRIPAKFYPEIATNDRQRDEWVRSFSIDEIKGNKTTPGYSTPLTVDFLKANAFLFLDTALFDEIFKEKLLAELDDLDDQCNGLLIQSENFQALNAIQGKLSNQVSCICIDPPYNTGSDGFCYKDGYKSSSWLSQQNQTLPLALSALDENGSLFAFCDENEVRHFGLLLEEIFDRKNFVETIIWNKRVPKNDKGIGNIHDFVFLLAKDFSRRRAQGLEYKMRKDEIDEIYEIVRKSKAAGISLEEAQQELKKFYRKQGYDRGLTLYCELDPNFEIWGKINMSWPNAKTEGPRYEVINPVTKVASPIPDNGWRWKEETYRAAELEGPTYTLPDGSMMVGRIWYSTKTTVQPSSITYLKDVESFLLRSILSVKSDGSVTLDDLGLGGQFDYPKSVLLTERLLYSTDGNQGLILDYFGGSGTTGHAVINLNRDDSGGRKFVLIEMGEYFDTVLVPRLKKAAYSSEWKGGKPGNRKSGLSQAFKIVRFEGYEDTLNNLCLNAVGNAVAKIGDQSMQRDHLLRYMLDVETQGSASLLNVTQFSNPTTHQLEIKKLGSDERIRRNVDLIETFNWLIGLRVDRLHAGQRFMATFARKADPLLPEEAITRLLAATLVENQDGAWWFRPVEGHIRNGLGDERHRQNVLVLWRTLTADSEQDAAVLDAFLAQKLKFNPTRREDKALYDVIYINGTHNLPNLGKYGEVRLLEEEFHRRMWAGG